MRILLDTHTLLWFLLDDPQLGLGARLLIEDPATEMFSTTLNFNTKGVTPIQLGVTPQVPIAKLG